MQREAYHIVLRRQSFPRRDVISIEPRSVIHPSEYYALADHAEARAAELRDQLGFTIVDRRGGN